MKNDVESAFIDIEIDKIGKYNKFIDFDKDEWNENLHQFSHSSFEKEKLGEDERFLAMERMQEFLDKKIEDELKQDYKLQKKIEVIEDKIRKAKEKAKLRIDKLKSKPKKKLQEKYGYKRMEEYFEPKLANEEES